MAKGIEEKETINIHALPLISKLPSKEMKESAALLEELEAAAEMRATAEAREEEIKTRLGQLQEGAGLSGLRYGNVCFYQQQMDGRKTLSPELLIENGVGVEVIERCYKQGKPYYTRNFRRLS